MENKKLTKVFLVKYCLTDGILTEAEGVVDEDGKSVRVKGYYNGFYGKDWSLDKETATKMAKEKQKKKIATLQKQIKKIESITFE